MGKTITGVSNPGDVVVVVPDYKAEYELGYYYNSTADGTQLIGATNTSEVMAACRGHTCLILLSRDNTGTHPVFNFLESFNGWDYHKHDMDLDLYRLPAGAV